MKEAPSGKDDASLQSLISEFPWWHRKSPGPGACHRERPQGARRSLRQAAGWDGLDKKDPSGILTTSPAGQRLLRCARNDRRDVGRSRQAEAQEAPSGKDDASLQSLISEVPGGIGNLQIPEPVIASDRRERGDLCARRQGGMVWTRRIPVVF